MSSLVDRSLEGFATTVGFVLVLGLLALQLGGMTYRKDCASGQGGVSKEWTLQWYTPIPYLFRPSESGCEVHTGTRVALSWVGVFPIKEKSAGDIARESTGSDPAGDGARESTTAPESARNPTVRRRCGSRRCPGPDNGAYYAGVYAVAADLQNLAGKGRLSQEEGENVLLEKRRELNGLTPYDYVAADHDQMVRAFDAVIADHQRAYAALRSGDREAGASAAAAFIRHVEEFYTVAGRIRTVLERGGA